MWCDAAYASIRGRSRRAGFTLLELMIVMTIMLIVAGVAVPAIQSVARVTRIETARQTFIGDLRLARTEAIRRNRTVTVQKTSPTTYTIEYIGGRTLQEGAVFLTGPDEVRFAAFGPVLTGIASYTLKLEGQTTTVSLSAAGNASVQ